MGKGYLAAPVTEKPSQTQRDPGTNILHPLGSLTVSPPNGRMNLQEAPLTSSQQVTSEEKDAKSQTGTLIGSA